MSSFNHAGKNAILINLDGLIRLNNNKSPFRYVNYDTATEGTMKVRTLLLTAVSFMFLGCANLSTLSRSTTLPGEGRAIHLDAAQRVVFAKTDGTVCAEPSPDALQAYAASLGLGISRLGTGTAEVAQAFSAGSGSIGLRTQSITLMRDHLFRICEASHNKKLTAPDVAQLFRRSQDMTLGVLAIEQLTGAVVARQVILGGDANAKASGNVTDTQSRLDQTKNDEKSKKEALSQAKEQQIKQEALVKSLEDDLKLAKTPPAGGAVDPIKVTALQDRLKTENAKLEENRTAVKAATEDYAKAQELTKIIADNVDAAKASAKATARVKGEFSESVERSTIDKDTVKELSRATQQIVRQVLEKGHLTDSCISMMNLYATEKSAEVKLGYEPLLKICTEIIQASLKKYLASDPSGPSPAPTAIHPM